MAHMTGGSAAAAMLEALGVDTVFGVPSQHNLALYDAIARLSSIRLIGARHEAGAVHAADGYSRATRRLGVAIVSTGPGTANAMNGLYEAAFASSRVLLITTQIDRVHLGGGKAFIHDAEGQLAMLQSVARAVQRPRCADQIAGALLSVANDVMTGRPQPGVVEIPTDLLIAPVVSNVPEVLPITPVLPDPAAMDRLAERLAAAERPILWVGGGSVDAGAAGLVQQLAEHVSAPVVSSLNGRSAMPTDHPLFIGSTTHYPDFRPLLAAADLVLAIGTRFQAVATWFWSLDLSGKLVQIDVEPAMIGRNYPAGASVVADAAGAIHGLLERLPARQGNADFLRLAAGARDAMTADLVDRIGPAHVAFCDAIDRHLPQDRMIVCDATMAGNSWDAFRLPVRDHRGFTYSTSLAIGPALPLGIGAAIGSGRRTVVIHGDGGVMLNLAELATAVETQAPVILLVFNDRGYGVLRTLQDGLGVPHVAVDLHTPDFVAVGHAMGMAATCVADPESFDNAIAEAASRAGPTLIEIDLSTIKAPRL